jgi:formylglycine-generating enzyme required for sulfatase activity
MHLRLVLIIVAAIFAACCSSAGNAMAQGNPKQITNSIGMKLVLVSKGTFTMGSPPEEEGAGFDEEQHEVTISKDYYLCVTEVTQGHYERIMGVNPSHFQKRVIRKSDSSMYPVEQVSCDAAVEFCKRLTELPAEKKAGRVYRLPTEAEWEYSCRAGSKTAYSFGDDKTLLNDYAWYKENSSQETHPVGEKEPNAWGLYDMHGNVWEWCSDVYGEYSAGAITDPLGPELGSGRVCRGGGSGSEAPFCRSADRDARHPSVRIIQEDGNFGGPDRSRGFRIAMSPFEFPQ